MLADDMAGACVQGGHIILSGILNEQADEVQTCYSSAGFELRKRRSIGDWTTLTLSRS